MWSSHLVCDNNMQKILNITAILKIDSVDDSYTGAYLFISDYIEQHDKYTLNV